MRLKIFLSILAFAVPIACLNGVLESAEAFCQPTITAASLSVETSGFQSFIKAKRCNSKQGEFVQIANCWEPGDLPSQRRYCLGEGLIEIETALLD